MTDLITIASDVLTARINPLGAELWSLTDRDGREYMTDADPAFWTGRAPLLFPIVGALNGGRYRLGDAEYALPKHGFARTSLFELLGAFPDSALFTLGDTPETLAVYPFRFSLNVHFRVTGFRLWMSATVQSRSDEPMPFSFGFHPAFAWPLPGGAKKSAHRIVFAEEEPQPIRRIDPSGLLLPDLQPTPVVGRELAPQARLFEDDALIWDRLNSRSLSFGSEGGPSLDIEFSGTPMLGIWQKPGANYLCIEPWQGIADPTGFAGDFSEKPGVVVLPPRKTLDFIMGLTLRPAP